MVDERPESRDVGGDELGPVDVEAVLESIVNLSPVKENDDFEVVVVRAITHSSEFLVAGPYGHEDVLENIMEWDRVGDVADIDVEVWVYVGLLRVPHLPVKPVLLEVEADNKPR